MASFDFLIVAHGQVFCWCNFLKINTTKNNSIFIIFLDFGEINLSFKRTAQYNKFIILKDKFSIKMNWSLYPNLLVYWEVKDGCTVQRSTTLGIYLEQCAIQLQFASFINLLFNVDETCTNYSSSVLPNDPSLSLHGAH